MCQGIWHMIFCCRIFFGICLYNKKCPKKEKARRLFDLIIQNAQRIQNASGNKSKKKKMCQKVIHIQKGVFMGKRDL